MKGLVAIGAALQLAVSSGGVLPATDVGDVALSGPHVAWVQTAERPEVHLDDAVIWRAPPVAVPPDAPTGSTVTQTATVAASPRLVAVLRYASVIEPPPCLHAVPPCEALPVLAKRIVGDVWAGPPGGPLLRLPQPKGSCVGAVDVSGRFVAEAVGACGLNAPDRIRVLSTPSRRVVFDRAVGVVVDEVALTWPYVAWYQRHVEFSHGMPSSDGIEVLDLRSGRIAYRLAPAKLYTNNTPGLAVEADGTVGLVVDRPPQVPPCATNQLGVAWASRRRPFLHFLEGGAWSSSVRVRGGRLAYARAASCAASHPQIVVAGIKGGLQVVAKAADPFDFDGHRVAWVGANGIHVTPVSTQGH